MFTHVRGFCQRILSKLKQPSISPSPLSLREELISLSGQSVFVESQVIYKNIVFLNQMIQSKDDFHIPLLVTSFPRALNFWDMIEKYRNPCIVQTIRSFEELDFDMAPFIRGEMTLILAYEDPIELVRTQMILRKLSEKLAPLYLDECIANNRFVFDDVSEAFEGEDLTQWRILAAKGASLYHLNTVGKSPAANRDAWGDCAVLHGDIETVGSVKSSAKICNGMLGEQAALRPFSQDDLNSMSLSGRFMQKKQNTFYVYSLD